MLITFLRHATAEPPAEQTMDAERALIKKGQDQVLRVAEFCSRNELTPSGLYSSPAERALQTAYLLQTRLPHCPQLEIADWLGLNSDPHTIQSALMRLEDSGIDEVWLVGHEPTISQSIGQLLGSPGLGIVIKKASLTRIEVDFSNLKSSELLWSIPCALMR